MQSILDADWLSFWELVAMAGTQMDCYETGYTGEQYDFVSIWGTKSPYTKVAKVSLKLVQSFDIFRLQLLHFPTARYREISIVEISRDPAF